MTDDFLKGKMHSSTGAFAGSVSRRLSSRAGPGRRTPMKKVRDKSRVELGIHDNKKECEDMDILQMIIIDYRKVIFSAFYDCLVDTIVAEREILEHKEQEFKGPSSPQASASTVDVKKSSKSLQECVENNTLENASNCEHLEITKEKIIYKNGNIYEGETSSNRIFGNGIFRWSDGTIYEGQFKNGYPSGVGKMVMPDLSVYEGDFCNGCFHGNGTLNITSTPIHYSGEWKNGKKHGNGWLLYEHENWYDGNWFEDSKNGLGTRKYKTGSKYKGNWIDNIKKGQGKMMWENNDYYVGEWADNLPNGYGEYTWSIISNTSLCFPSFNWYKGSWVDGMRTGIGIMNFGTECGSKLAGTWRHNEKHGPGVMMCGNGKFIECNPLFEYDKPVHKNSRKTLKDIFADENIDTSPQGPESSFRDISALINKKIALQEFPDPIILNITKNGSNLDCKNFSKIYDSISGNKKMWCPLKIPIHSVGHEVDLTYYIDMIYEQLSVEQKNEAAAVAITLNNRKSKLHSKNFGSSIHSEKSAPLQDTSCDAIVFKKDGKSKLRDTEAFHLRNIIIINLSKLSQIYNTYASFTKKKSLSFKPVLVRLFLWQLYRDLHLTEDGVSLVESDLMLARNPASCVESEHYPFEPIYFYQFIQSLVGSSWLRFVEEKGLCPVHFGEGFLANIFKTFLEEVVYVHSGTFMGNVLTTYKDSIPITAMYNLYLSLGEPISVRTFLNATHTRRGVEPPCYYAINAVSKPLNDGYNAVSIANEIHYHPTEDATDNLDSALEENKCRLNKDPFCQSLYTFRTLGKKSIVHCLNRICPRIVGPNLSTDYSYTLTFLEFYEVLLRCALMKAEETRREQEISLREAARRMTIDHKFSLSAMSRTNKDKFNRKKKSKKSVLTF